MSNEIVATPARPPAQRTLSKLDYERMYRLLEAGGVSKEMICEAYGINLHTFNLRLKKDRPHLAETLKAFPTSKKVDMSSAGALEKMLETNGRKVRGGLTRVIAHTVDALNVQVDEEEEAAARDPNKKITPFALKHAKDLLSIAKTMGTIPGTGMVSGSVGPSVNVGVTLNHATVMRASGEGILAEEMPEEAIVTTVESQTAP